MTKRARKTLRHSPLASLLVAALAAAMCIALITITLGGCSSSRTEGLDPSKLPENVRADYELFARRCSKCHSLARPLSSGITDDEQWVNYVNRMRRQPGSGISLEDQEGILRFLHYFAAELRRKEAEKHAPTPSSSTSTSPSPEPPTTGTTTPPPPPPAPPPPPPSPSPSTAPVPATDLRPLHAPKKGAG